MRFVIKDTGSSPEDSARFESARHFCRFMSADHQVLTLIELMLPWNRNKDIAQAYWHTLHSRSSTSAKTELGSSQFFSIFLALHIDPCEFLFSRAMEMPMGFPQPLQSGHSCRYAYDNMIWQYENYNIEWFHHDWSYITAYHCSTHARGPAWALVAPVLSSFRLANVGLWQSLQILELASFDLCA